VELAVNNVGVAGCKPLNSWPVEIWLFFDQAFLPGVKPGLSTFLMMKKSR
jgi:hypothetical protein